MALLIENITIKSTYGTILNDVSLHVKANTICGIVGASGAGKSVLLHSIIKGLADDLSVKGKVFCPDCILMPQDINEAWNPTKKISSQLPQQNIAKISTLLQELQLDFSFTSLKKYPSSFSQGELQRLSILLALLQDKKVILLDEPTAFLDLHNKNKLQHLLQKLPQQGYTLVIATHELDWLTNLTSNIYQLQDRQISEYILPTNKNPENLLGSFIQVELSDYDNTNHINSNSILNIKQGQVSYNKETVLRNLNFQLDQGDVLAIIGSSGVGKTSLAKAIVNQDNYKLQGIITRNYITHYIAQNYSAGLTPHLTLKDNLLIAFKKYKGINRYSHYKQILTLCHRLNLASTLLKKYPTQLSLGEKQRFILIRSLLFYMNNFQQQTQVLVLDEITSSLNSVNQHAVINLLQDFLTKYGLTYILITHNANIVQKLANKCLQIIGKSNNKFYTKNI